MFTAADVGAIQQLSGQRVQTRAEQVWRAYSGNTLLGFFFVDYVMQKQGFGPYFNTLLIGFGIWLGFWVRFNYLQPNRLHFYDPYLTICAIFGVISTMFVVMAFVRNRTS